MGIIAVDAQNLNEFTNLSLMLFPEDTFDEALTIYKNSFKTEKEVGFLYQKDNKYIGILHLSIRNDYVNGTNSSPVVYVEAIYVLPDYRKHGIGKELLSYADEKNPYLRGGIGLTVLNGSRCGYTSIGNGSARQDRHTAAAGRRTGGSSG